MKRYCSFLITILFCIYVVSIGILTLTLPTRTITTVEMNSPVPRPSLSTDSILSGKFASETKAYCKQHIPFQTIGTSLCTATEILLGKNEMHDVFFGTDGALYPKMKDPDYTQLSKNVQAIDSFAQRLSIPVTVSLIPTATEIYASALPLYANSPSQKTIQDFVQKGLNFANYTNCYNMVQEHKNESLYYRTDPHCTSLGSYYMYNALLSDWGMSPKALHDYPDLVPVTHNFFGTLAQTSHMPWIEPDTITRMAQPDGTTEVLQNGTFQPWSLYHPKQLTSHDAYRYFLGDPHALVKITTKTNQGSHLLIVRDSVADSMAPFFAENFAQVHLLYLQYQNMSLTEYVLQNEITHVLFLSSTPTLATTKEYQVIR